MSVFGVILFRIFPHSDWIRRDIVYFTHSEENETQKTRQNLKKKFRDYLVYFRNWTSIVKQQYIKIIIRTNKKEKNLLKAKLPVILDYTPVVRQTFKKSVKDYLKDLRNCTSCVIRVCSLFNLIRAYISLLRSSHQRCSLKEGVLKSI